MFTMTTLTLIIDGWWRDAAKIVWVSVYSSRLACMSDCYRDASICLLICNVLYRKSDFPVIDVVIVNVQVFAVNDTPLTITSKAALRPDPHSK